MEGLPNWQVYGVPALIFVVAVLNWLKEAFGLDSKWAFPVSTIIGGVIGALLYFSSIYPVVLTITQILLGAILIGLAASGYYSGTKKYIEKNGG